MSKFPTTRWSLVAAAAGGGADAGPAQGELYRLYLSPILARARRFFRSHDAQDLTQGVFARIVTPGGLATVEPERVRFHTWLMRQAWNLASSERKACGRKKRGGDAVVVSLDALAANGHEPADPHFTPDRELARRRTLDVLDQVASELERTSPPPHRAHFQRLKRFLDGREMPYETLARELGVPACTLRQQVRRMRALHRSLLRAHFRRMGVKPADIDREIRNLFAALA